MYIFPKGVNATSFQTIVFNEKLSEISSIYKRFFETTAEKESLAQYLKCFGVGGAVHMHIKEELPSEIARDCRRAFHSIFG